MFTDRGRQRQTTVMAIHPGPRLGPLGPEPGIAAERSAGPGTRPGGLLELVLAHQAEIYRYLRRLSPSADEAADLHQETFLRAAVAFERAPSLANGRAWLYRIAGNLAIDAHRRRVTRSRVESGPVLDHPRAGPEAHTEPTPGSADRLASGGRTDPLRAAEAAELRATVRAALLGLSERQRLAVIARVLEGAPYEEVATRLGCREQTARKHVSLGLRRLRVELTAYLEASTP